MPEELQITLCDQQAELVREWEKHFHNHSEVEVRLGDLLDVYADAYVSPANSHGWMDGGIDLELRSRFMAGDIETKVQRAISKFGSVLPVGQALIVETDDEDIPYLVVAPTMEVPSFVGMSSNAYKAMAALLRAISKFNSTGDDAISSVAVPGLCTGVGGMEPRVAALQMYQAYLHWLANDD
ncbi:MAG: macro domain-containing protein [Abitibacteriaceae bacterium]|nr:macro domain-containing protein [Abditibacteriaceae bacterium]MBV9867857.1 macro domain-containing protein [Abditibacteriaceae bacterium]